MKIQLKDVVIDSFKTYAAMVIKERALIDARDCLKPSQRICIYAQYLDKLTYKKPFKKSQKSVTAAMDHFYIHGDDPCYDLMVRMARPFNMMYPLEEFHGQYGDLSNPKPAAYRYTDMRLGELGVKMIDGIEKECIDIWFDNYDNTEKYPYVLPSLGYYNICNGTQGIAVGIAASIPQFNILDVNEAMIKLLWNRDISYDEIYCAPDFCTGGTIMNASEVKKILEVGQGGSAKLRATATYNEKENAIHFTEIPYGVYADGIIEKIKDLANTNAIPGIKGLNDNCTDIADIVVFLEKGANPNKIVKSLFKETDLQKCYTIKMEMLDRGAIPKIFGWREALLAHIDHEIEVRTKIYEYEIPTIQKRLHIVDGFMIAIANMDELLELVRKSKNKDEAKIQLITRFGYDDEQATAILKLTISKLTALELQSFRDEQEHLTKELNHRISALNDKNILYKEIEDDMRAVAEKYSKPRKTRLMDFDFKGEEEDAEPIERKELLIHFTNLNNIYTQESTTLLTTRRGGKGTKVKLAANEVIIQTINDDNFGSLLAFSNKGKMYTINTDDLPINAKINITQLFEMESGEKITTLTTLAKKNSVDYFVFLTKNGMIKKTKASEYEHRRGKSLKAINLKDDDEVVSVHFMNNERVGILTFNGNCVIINTDEINPIGRATAGVKAIKLNPDDYVICSQVINPNDNLMITISKDGLIKKSSMEEFPICGRATKGRKISGIKDEDRVVKFLTLREDCDIINISSKNTIKINTSELRCLSRDAVGVKAISLNPNEVVVDLVKNLT